MTTNQLIAFKDYILAQNTYISKGFAVAFKDTVSKQVLCHSGTDFVQVMPNDTLGNYFYIRYVKGIEFTADYNSRIADNQKLNLSYLDKMPVVLVFVVKDADPYALLDNIRVTCAGFSNFKVIPTGAVTIPEIVIQDEMSGADKGDIQAALQRAGGYTIISVSATITKQYYPTKCISDPCKSCADGL